MTPKSFKDLESEVLAKIQQLEMEAGQTYDEIYVHKLPEELGGTWAYAAGGIMSDGYETEEDARNHAIKDWLAAEYRELKDFISQTLRQSLESYEQAVEVEKLDKETTFAKFDSGEVMEWEGVKGFNIAIEKRRENVQRFWSDEKN